MVSDAPKHYPVLLNEIISIITPQHGGTFIDCTFGQGGYSKEILKFNNTKVIGLDRDSDSKKIAELTDDVVFVDTHAFISTDEGFYTGLPYHVIQILEPTHLIAISARPEEIYNRRMKDDSRNRDKISIEAIKKELAVQDAMLASCSVLSGSPLKVILNNEGKIDEAAQNVIDAIGVGV